MNMVVRKEEVLKRHEKTTTAISSQDIDKMRSLCVSGDLPLLTNVLYAIRR